MTSEKQQRQRSFNPYTVCRDTLVDLDLIYKTVDCLKVHYQKRNVPKIYPVESNQFVFTVMEPLDQSVLMQLTTLGWEAKTIRPSQYEYRHECYQSSSIASVYYLLGLIFYWGSILGMILVAISYGYIRFNFQSLFLH